VIVEVGPQSVTERSFMVGRGRRGKRRRRDENLTRPADARLAGVTRIAFDASSLREMPLTSRALLDWSKYALRIRSPQRRNGSAPDSSLSHTAETAIEAPWRLFLSPESTAWFRHSEGHAIPKSTRTDLFRTDLADGLPSAPTSPRIFPLAAIAEDPPFLTAMTGENRKDIVARAKNEPFVEEELPQDEPGFDGFAEANLVRE
jgi:hypothetical protein